MPDQPTPPHGHLVEVIINTRDGNLRGKLMLPASNLTFGEFAYLSNGLTDRVIGLSVKKDEAQGHTVSCRKGCAACCRQLVPVSPPEAFMLADFVDQQPPANRESLLERLESTVRTLESSGLLERLLSPPSGLEEIRALSREYHELNLACPFLEDELCGIYPFRPAACRSYLVTTPAENCSKLFSREIRPVPVQLRMSRCLAHVYAEMTDEAPAMIPLPMVLRWVRDHPEQRTGTHDAVAMLNGLLAHMNEMDTPGS